MSIQSFTAGSLRRGFNVTEPAIAFVDAVYARLALYRRYQTVKSELLDYSPEQLGELGISDADIEFVAENAART